MHCLRTADCLSTHPRTSSATLLCRVALIRNQRWRPAAVPTRSQRPRQVSSLTRTLQESHITTGTYWKVGTLTVLCGSSARKTRMRFSAPRSWPSTQARCSRRSRSPFSTALVSVPLRERCTPTRPWARRSNSVRSITTVHDGSRWGSSSGTRRHARSSWLASRLNERVCSNSSDLSNYVGWQVTEGATGDLGDSRLSPEHRGHKCELARLILFLWTRLWRVTRLLAHI
mmetsp:Transcript_780/g.2227  ORF Transcript_780/g.2227 Transcript_780/m.2227 type:complete len:229 (-) Transcript_780:20-706(-)